MAVRNVSAVIQRAVISLAVVGGRRYFVYGGIELGWKR